MAARTHRSSLIPADITVWDVDSGAVVHVFEDVSENDQVDWPPGDEFVPELVSLDPPSEEDVACFFVRSPDDQYLVEMIDQTLWAVEASSGTRLAELLPFYCGPSDAARFSPDGRLLVAVSDSLPVQIWDTTTWELIATLPTSGQVIAFSPDGTQLAVTASWDVQIWDVDELLAPQQAIGANQ